MIVVWLALGLVGDVCVCVLVTNGLTIIQKMNENYASYLVGIILYLESQLFLTSYAIACVLLNATKFRFYELNFTFRFRAVAQIN